MAVMTTAIACLKLVTLVKDYKDINIYVLQNYLSYKYLMVCITNPLNHHDELHGSYQRP